MSPTEPLLANWNCTLLRWYGLLANEPALLPWGYSFDLVLSDWDSAAGYIPLSGGLRARISRRCLASNRNHLSGGTEPLWAPKPGTATASEDNGSRILRTDKEGAIQVLTDGRTLRLNCNVACPRADTVSGSAQFPNHSQGDQ